MPSAPQPLLVASSGLPADAYSRQCPTRQVLDRLADKWTVLILGALAERTHRFAELRRRVDGVSEKMLAQTLRGLERDGILTREVFPTVPPRTEYTLTPLGQSLAGPLIAVRTWAEANINEIETARDSYDARPAPARK
jgi:DNA-binding HxlR family transcriptional regulator